MMSKTDDMWIGVNNLVLEARKTERILMIRILEQNGFNDASSFIEEYTLAEGHTKNSELDSHV